MAIRTVESCVNATASGRLPLEFDVVSCAQTRGNAPDNAL
jgi:hypothetical protein